MVIRAGRVLDVRSQKTLPETAIVVDGKTIVEMRPWAGFHLAANAHVIDLKDSTVLPGLIDAHTHLLSEFQDGLDPTGLLARMSTASRALLGARVAKEMLDTGFTMVRDLGNSGRGGDLALRDAINAGWVPGPRMLVSTRAISPPGGQFGPLPARSRSMVEEEYAEVSGVEDARRAARQAIADGADCIKIIVGQSEAVLSLEEMKAIVEEARRADRGGARNRRVAAHAFGDFDARLAIDAGVDSVEHGYSLSDGTLQLMAEKKIYLVPTDESEADPLIEGQAKRQGITAEELRKRMSASREALHARLRKALEMGVPIAAGSDNYIGRPAMNRGQGSLLMLDSLREAGLTPWQVLKAATAGAAGLLGWGDRTGSLQPGYVADIIAVHGDPLTDSRAIRAVHFVMKDGQIVLMKN